MSWRLAAVAVLIPLTAAADDPPKPKRVNPGYTEKKFHDPDGIGKFYLGREIARVMGYQAAGWLERKERVKEEEPQKLLAALDVKPGMVVADVGAGSGYHTFRLAPLVGDTGKVIASDIQPQMLKLIRDKAKQQNVANVEAVQGTETDPKLPAGVDLIILVDVYHEFSHPFEMAEKMADALKPGGRLVFVEFKANDPDVPIKPVHTMTERQVIKEMEPFPELEHTKTVPLAWQNVIIFTKKKDK